MGGTGSGRKPEPKFPIPKQPDFFLPNHSGDLSAGDVLKTPVNENDPVNKKYVDDSDFWDRTGTVLSPKTSGDDVELDNDLLMKQVLNENRRIKFSDELWITEGQQLWGQGYLHLGGTPTGGAANTTIIGANNSLVLDANDSSTDEDASGNYEPTLQLNKDGTVLIKNTSQGDAANRKLTLNFTSGVEIATGTLFADGIGTGLDVLHSAEIGNHLIVGDNLTVDTNTLFVNATTKRVGIGTVSPDTTLDVAGVFTLHNLADTALGLKIAEGGDTGSGTFNDGVVFQTPTGTTPFEWLQGASSRMVIHDNGFVGVGTVAPTLPLDVKAKSGHTAIGGIAIKLTNKTGSNTVAGQLVKVDTTTNDAFNTQDANGDNTVGIVLDAGVANNLEAWIIISGIADVLIDAGGSARGDRLISSATAGSADVWNVGGAVATHFLEIGHCIETRGGAGLARCILHFN